jgi:prevent-host-death family protein
MEKRLGVTEARDQLSDIVAQVQYKGNAYILSRHGKPAAALVPIEVYESWRQQRRFLFDTVRKIQQANPEIDPEKVWQDVLQSQRATRTAQK